MDRREVGCIFFAFPGLPEVECAFTTRTGGFGEPPYAGANYSFDVGDDPRAVRSNREALRERLGFDSWVELNQVHGTEVHVDPVPGRLGRPGALPGDGSVTSAPGRALVVKTADCQPILLAHKSGNYVMALHVGWRGNLADLPGRGVAVFCAAYGLDPSDILAVRGPSLGPAHSEFINFDEEFGPEFARWHDAETRTVDLWSLTRHQLCAAGLRPENVFGLDLCTKSLPESFFSYRAERVTGRQAALIWIKRK